MTVSKISCHFSLCYEEKCGVSDEKCGVSGEKCGMPARDLNWWLLFLFTAAMLFATKDRKGSLPSLTLTVVCTYRQQFSDK